MPQPKRILLLGTGGGSLVHFLRHHYPHSHLTGVDIDGELLDLMHEKMHLPKADDHLTYVIDDAANYLHHCNQTFDLILVDIFIGDQSPDWLLSVDWHLRRLERAEISAPLSELLSERCRTEIDRQSDDRVPTESVTKPEKRVKGSNG